jgi:hypothetical protein
VVQVDSAPDALTVRSPEEQQSALERALEAAKRGDALGMLRELHVGQIHDGLFRQLKTKWPGLQAADVDAAIGEAEDALFEQVRGGRIVRSIAGFLWRAGDRACQRLSERRPALPEAGA